MKPVTKYESDDGEYYNTEQEALRADAVHALMDYIYKCTIYDAGELKLDLIVKAIVDEFHLVRHRDLIQPAEG